MQTIVNKSVRGRRSFRRITRLIHLFRSSVASLDPTLPYIYTLGEHDENVVVIDTVSFPVELGKFGLRALLTQM